MIELYLNGTLVDLDPDSRVLLSKAANDIGEFQKAKGEFANTMKVVRTPAMDAFFGYPTTINSTFEKVYQRFEALIKSSGADIMEGFAYVEDIDEDFYNVQVMGDNFDLFNRIKGKELQDLNMSEHDHIYDAAEVVARRNDLTGLCYPDVNYGGQWDTGSGSSHKVFTDWRPSIYVKYALQSIVTEAGFTVDTNSELFNNDKFNRTVIPQCGAFKRTANPRRMDFSFSILNYTNSGLSVETRIQVNNYAGSSVYYVRSASNIMTRVEPIRHAFRVTIQINTLAAPATYRIYSPGGTTYAENTATTTGVQDFVFEWEDFMPFDNTASDGFDLWASNGTTNPYIVNSGSITATGLEFVNAITGEKVKDQNVFRVADENGKRAVEASGILPKMKQTDFVKWIFTTFGVIQSVDTDQKVVRFDLLNNIPNKAPQALTVDFSEQPKFKPYFGNYAQSNLFVWEQDAKDPLIAPNPIYGRGEIVCSYAALDPQKEHYQAPFAAAAVKLCFTSHQVNAVCIPSADDIAQKLMTVRLKTTGNAIRIDGYSYPSEWLESTWELDYSVLIPDYYGNWLDTFRLPMQVEARLNIDIVQYMSFDFAQPVYIESLNGFFYMNSISEFDASLNESVTCELIAIR
jgi:hypothetical protein